jgi:hypothetical protein
VYGLALSRSGYGCEGMVLMYLGQDRGVSVWMALSRSVKGNDRMGWLYLGQDMGVSIWSG